MRRLAWMLALMGAASSFAALPASASSLQVQTFELVRTTAGPAWFQFHVQGSPSASQPHGFDATIAARVVKGRVVSAASLGAYTFDYDYGVHVQAASHEVSACQPLGGCIVNRVLAYASGVDDSDNGEADAFNRFYIVEEGPASVTFRANGWQLRRVSLSYRYVTDAAADADGIFTGDQGYELFRSATATGGAFGSIATGDPPCSNSTAGIGLSPPRGLGTATLSGGNRSSSLTCPTNIGTPLLTGSAGTRMNWRLTGPVVGDSTFAHVPLFVLDLPRNP